MKEFKLWLLDVLTLLERYSIKGIISFKDLDRLCQSIANSMNHGAIHREDEAQLSKQEMKETLKFLLMVSYKRLDEIQRKSICLINALHIQINEACLRAERYLSECSSLDPLNVRYLKRYIYLSKHIYLKLERALNESDSPNFALNAVSIYRQEFQRMRDCLGIMPLRTYTSLVYQDIKQIKHSIFNESRIKLYKLSNQYSLFLVLYIYVPRV